MFMVWKISSGTNLIKQHYVDASTIEQHNWCDYEYILSKTINAGYLSLKWLEFVLVV